MRKNTLPIDEIVRNVALEASVPMMLSNAGRMLGHFFPKLIETQDNHVESMVEVSDNLPKLEKEIDKKQLAFRDSFKNVPYLTLGQKQVTVPENFQGKLSDYVKTLNQCMPDSYVITVNHIQKLDVIVSIIVSQSSSRESKLTSYDKELQTFLKVQQSNLDKYFPRHDNRTRVRLLDVLDSKPDFDTYLDEVNKLQRNVNRIDLHNLKRLVNNLDQKLKLLDGVLVEDNEHIQSVKLKELVTYSYDVAKMVEHTSRVYFESMVVFGTTSSLLELLK